MTHVEALDCPCKPVTMRAVGGGSVQVHRDDAKLLRELEDKVHALPAEGRRHVGLFVEKAAVLALLDPRRRRDAA